MYASRVCVIYAGTRPSGTPCYIIKININRSHGFPTSIGNTHPCCNAARITHWPSHTACLHRASQFALTPESFRAARPPVLTDPTARFNSPISAAWPETFTAKRSATKVVYSPL